MQPRRCWPQANCTPLPARKGRGARRRSICPSIENLEARQCLSGLIGPAAPGSTIASTAAFNPTPSDVKSGIDSNVAAGPTEVIVASGGQLQFFEQPALGSSSLSLLTLFPDSQSSGPYDARIVYDPANGGHFLLTAVEHSASGSQQAQASYLDIAVSKAAAPEADPTSWNIYRANGLQTIGGALSYVDFDGLGFDAQALYVTVNEFDFQNNFVQAELMTFDKNALEDGKFSPLQELITPANTLPIPGGYSVQPAITYGAAPAEYMIEAWNPTDAATSTQVRVHAIVNPLGAIADVTANVTVPEYATYVPNAPQLGVTQLIRTGDTSILSAAYAGGSLWAAGNVGDVATGLAQARWYRIDVNGANGPLAAVLDASGSADGGSGVSTYYPAIAVDASGNAVVSFGESSSTMYPSLGAMTLPASGSGTTTMVQPGLTPFTATAGWGDFSGATIDPVSTGAFYVSGEYASAKLTAASAWERITIGCATPSAVETVAAPSATPTTSVQTQAAPNPATPPTIGPNSNIAAGPTEVLAAVNYQLEFFSKAGDSSASISFLTLFPNSEASKPHDPRLVYDPANGGHFILTADEHTKPGSAPYGSFLDIAVSKDSTPSALPASWFVYRANDLQTVGGTNYYVDFDGLGFDAEALYVTANLLSLQDNSFFKAELVTFNKTALETGMLGTFPSLIAPANVLSIPGGYSVQPAITYGASAAEYLIEAWDPSGAPTSTTVRVHAITNPLGAIADSTAIVTVPEYATFVPNAPQLGTSVPIHTVDDSMLGAMEINGSLWASENVGSVSAAKSVGRWYEIATNGWSGSPGGTLPKLTHSSDIDPGPGIFTYYPSIAADSAGNVVVVYNESSNTMYPSVLALTIPAAGNGTTQLVQAGLAPYGYSRWGDYEDATADMTTRPGVFYVIGEYSNDTQDWATAWKKIVIAAPPVAGSPPPTVLDDPGKTNTTSLSPLEGDSGTDLSSMGRVMHTRGRMVIRRLAYFTSTDPKARATNFVAVIDWGDGSSSGPMTLERARHGLSGFRVYGRHTYAHRGEYTVEVKILESGREKTAAVSKVYAGVAEPHRREHVEGHPFPRRSIRQIHGG